jgi:hypothetical protein
MSEPWHRRWLHAIEDDATVPGTPMQIARIFADYAASKGGHWAHVSYPELIRQTHRTRYAIAAAIAYLVLNGWLTLRNDWRSGQEKSYDLIIPGQKRKRPAHQTGMPSRTVRPNRPARQDASVRPSRTQASGPADQSAQQDATVRPSRTQASGPAGRERLTSFTSLSLNGLQEALAKQVPDVTERETALVKQLIGRRRGIVSAAAVMRAEIDAGNGPDLVKQVREADQAIERAASGRLTQACRAGLHPRPGTADPACMAWCSCTCHA